MALVPASSRGGGGFAIPSTTNSVPAGTTLIVDEFGDFIVEGVGAPGFIGVSESPNDNGDTAFLSSSIGVRTQQKVIAVLDGIGNSAGAIQSTGALSTAGPLPVDGDIRDGEVWLWFDSTDGVGNTKLMVKGKSADGTVKAAAVVLA